MKESKNETELEIKKKLDDLKKLKVSDQVIVLKEFLKDIPGVNVNKSSDRVIRGYFFFRVTGSKKKERAYFTFKTSVLGAEIATIKDKRSCEVCTWSHGVLKIIEKRFQVQILEPEEHFLLK